jgi:hypothetical protein
LPIRHADVFDDDGGHLSNVPQTDAHVIRRLRIMYEAHERMQQTRGGEDNRVLDESGDPAAAAHAQPLPRENLRMAGETRVDVIVPVLAPISAYGVCFTDRVEQRHGPFAGLVEP